MLKSLTKQQQEYFENSQIRDEYGDLQVFYHATNAEFTAFDKEFIGNEHGSSFGEGFYFSSEPIPSYGKNMAVYLDVQKPYTLDLKNEANVSDFAKQVGIDDTDLKNWIVHFSGNVKSGINKALREAYAEDLQGLKDQGYDGLIILNTSVGLYNQPKQDIGKEIVVFEPNQIKSIDNKFPTKSADLFERPVLSKQQEEYFKDSKIREDNGDLKVAFHGTYNNFNAFDKIEKGPGYWFTEDYAYASEHGNKVLEVYLDIKNPFDLEVSNNDELVWDYVKDCFNIDRNEEKYIYTLEFRDYLMDKGYDGIMWKHSEHYTIIPFQPNQIKSIDNLYPTKSNDIYEKTPAVKETSKTKTIDERLKEAKAIRENCAKEKTSKEKNEPER